MEEGLFVRLAPAWLGVAAALCGGCGTGPDEPAPLVDVSTLQERLRQPEDRAVLLVFWATWCSPCIEEIPVLRELHADADLGLRVVSVSLDTFLEGPEGGRQLVLEFLQENPLPWEQYVYEGGQDELFEPFDMSGMIPLTILYDEEGAEIGRYAGRLQASQVRATLLTARY